MSSTTGSRHNCEQGQGYSPPQQRNHRGGGERHHHRPHPTGGAGGIPWGGGGEGGCGSPASSYPQVGAWDFPLAGERILSLNPETNRKGREPKPPGP